MVDKPVKYSLGPELDKYVDELLKISKTEGLITAKKKLSSAFNSDSRHIRGREIGQLLMDKGGFMLMVKVAEAFAHRGGKEADLSWCWDEISAKHGFEKWMA